MFVTKISRPRADSRSESGSAMMFAIVIMAVLTILGVSLGLATQTEVLSGGQERVMERTFYAAESGLGLSVGNALGNGDFGPALLTRRRGDLEEGNIQAVREEVQSSPFFCLGDAPCGYCSINQGRNFVRRNHVLSVAANRVVTGDGGVEVNLARKGLNTMVDIEPTQRTASCIADLPSNSSAIEAPE